jgi:hypothetical protein
MKLMQGVLAILAVAGLVAAVAIAPAAADGPAAQAAKKKCGKKKGKKGAVAAKKCKKKKKQSAGATGPSLPVGEWSCGQPRHSGMQTKAGNVYTVNNGNPGTYRYYPDTGIVQFQGGSYSWAFGKYDPDAKALEIYSNENDGILEVGDYAWTCTLSQ